MEKLIRDGDNVYFKIVVTEGEDYQSVRRTLVMTKEMFQECYREWIEGETDGTNGKTD